MTANKMIHLDGAQICLFGGKTNLNIQVNAAKLAVLINYCTQNKHDYDNNAY